MRNRSNYHRNHFFCLRFVFTIFYIGIFQVPPKKNHPCLKCQFLPKLPILPKSLLYKRSEKWLSPPFTQECEGGGGGDGEGGGGGGANNALCPPPPPRQLCTGSSLSSLEKCDLCLVFSFFTSRAILT